MKIKLFMLFLCSTACLSQQVQHFDQIMFNNNLSTKIAYLKNSRVTTKVLGSLLQPNFEMDVYDSAYSPNVGVNFWIRTFGGKIEAGFGAFGDGEFGVSGRRQGDSTGVFHRFMAIWNDTIRSFINGVEYTRLNSTGLISHKNIYLYDPTTDLTSPVLRFMQPNSVAGNTIDSVTLSMADSPLGAKALKISHPLQFTNTASNALVGLSELMTMNLDTFIVKGQSSIARWLPFGANVGDVPTWNGSAYAPAAQVGGGGGGGALSPIRIELQNGTGSIYPESILAFDSRVFSIAQGAPRRALISFIQDFSTTGSPTLANLTLGTSGFLTFTSGTGTNAFIDYPTGANSPLFHLPPFNGTFTLATTTGSTFGSGSIWNGGSMTSSGAITSTGSGSNLIIGGTGSSSIAGSLTVSGALTSANFNAIGSVTGRSFTLQNPTFTGSTVIDQSANSSMFITNTGGLYLDMPAVKFTNAPSMPYTLTLNLPNLSGNRNVFWPDISGTLVDAAVAPLSISNGQISITGGFLTSLNGLTAGVQTFSLAFSGTTPTIVSAVNDHQFRFQDAGVGMLHGFLTNGSQSISGRKTMIDPFTAQAEKIGYLRTTSTNYNVVEQSAYFECDPSVSGNMVMNLPNITSEVNLKYTFWRWTNGVGNNTVTIVPFGSEKIEGASSIVLSLDDDKITITNNGTSAGGWKVLGGQINGYAYNASFAGLTTLLAGTDSVDVPIAGMIPGMAVSASYSEPTNKIVTTGSLVAIARTGKMTIISPQFFDVNVQLTYYKK